MVQDASNVFDCSPNGECAMSTAVPVNRSRTGVGLYEVPKALRGWSAEKRYLVCRFGGAAR